MAFRILALDGGGLRGVFTLGLLRRLEAAKPGLVHGFDLYAGTSTGSILAAGLACGLVIDALEELYFQKARQIFGGAPNFGMVGAKYDLEGLREAVHGTFGEKRLGEVPKRLLVPAFHLGGVDADGRPAPPWSPKFFHNFPGDDSDAGELLTDVLVRSCAGPTYFPSHQDFVDGGVAANNPSLAAVATTLDPRNHPGGAPPPLSEIRLLSLGTGGPRRALPSGAHDWGKLHWMSHLFDLVFDGLLEVPDFQCRQILGTARYCRLAPALPEAIELDDVDALPRLKAWAASATEGMDAALAWVANP